MTALAAGRCAGVLPAEDRLALLRAEYAGLLAASRAAIAAERDGEARPLSYVAAVLEERGQVPPSGMHPAELLAAARQAAVLAGVVA